MTNEEVKQVIEQEPVKIIRKPGRDLIIHRNSFAVELISHEDGKVLETVGQGKSLSEAILVVDKYVLEHQQDLMDIDNSFAIQIVN